MLDPLADVIAAAARHAYVKSLSPSRTEHHLTESVRAHIAAVLDAEYKRGLRGGCTDCFVAINNLRTTLLGETP